LATRKDKKDLPVNIHVCDVSVDLAVDCRKSHNKVTNDYVTLL